MSGKTPGSDTGYSPDFRFRVLDNPHGVRINPMGFLLPCLNYILYLFFALSPRGLSPVSLMHTMAVFPIFDIAMFLL